MSGPESYVVLHWISCSNNPQVIVLEWHFRIRIPIVNEVKLIGLLGSMINCRHKSHRKGTRSPSLSDSWNVWASCGVYRCRVGQNIDHWLEKTFDQSTTNRHVEGHGGPRRTILGPWPCVNPPGPPHISLWLVGQKSPKLMINILTDPTIGSLTFYPLISLCNRWPLFSVCVAAC